jgi:Protein of unknown function (DUF2934)
MPRKNPSDEPAEPAIKKKRKPAAAKSAASASRKEKSAPVLPPIAQSASFAAPAEAHWHLMISEAAYFRAEKRGFVDGYSIQDWLEAEEQIRRSISS